MHKTNRDHEPHSKEALLEHYAEKTPTRFIQIDSWNREDAITGGPCVSCGSTVELMNGADVRMLIKPDLNPKFAAYLLRDAATWIERDPDILIKEQGIPELEPTADGAATEEPYANDGERQAMSRHLLSIQHFPGDLPRPILEIVRSSVHQDAPIMRAALAAVDQWRNEKRASEVSQTDNAPPF